MASPWVWEPEHRRYRNTETGRWIGSAGMIRLRDRFVESMRMGMRDLAVDLATGNLTVDQWESAMRKELKTLFVDEYVMAHGGRNTLTHADWGRIGSMVREQYKFLSKFAADIEAGRYTDAEGALHLGAVQTRAELYMDAGVYAYERAHALSYGIELPAYPGDGSTSCVTRCACRWSITEAEGGFNAVWTLGDADHCEDCEARAREWAPLFVPKTKP